MILSVTEKSEYGSDDEPHDSLIGKNVTSYWMPLLLFDPLSPRLMGIVHCSIGEERMCRHDFRRMSRL